MRGTRDRRRLGRFADDRGAVGQVFTPLAMNLDSLLKQPLHCPVCGKTEANVKFLCRACWFKVPAKDRVKFGQMVSRKQNTDTKLASMIAKLKTP